MRFIDFDTNFKGIFIIEKQVFDGFSKIIGASNKLLITFVQV